MAKSAVAAAPPINSPMDQAASIMPEAAPPAGRASDDGGIAVDVHAEDPIVEPSNKRPRPCHDDDDDDDIATNAETEKPAATAAAVDVATAAIVGDSSDDSHPRQFKMLPFYGEHKRAVSSVSFAPTISSSSSTGAMSYNSNATQVPILCASASADGCAKVWDITQSMNSSPSSSSKIMNNKDVDPSDAQASSSGSACTKLDPKITLIGHSRGINDVTWSPTSSYIVTASDDKSLRLWSAETGDAFVEFRGHSSFVFSCKFNPQSNLLVSGSYDETVKLWDIRCGECVATLPAHSNPVTGVDFNRDGTCIVSGSYDGLVRIWDTATGECLKTVYSEGNPPVGSVRFSPNGRYVLSGTLDSKLRLYDVLAGHGRSATFDTESHSNGRPQPRGGKCAKTYAGHMNTKYCVFAAFLSANPKRQCVVSGSEDGMVYLYDLQSRLIRQTLKGHTDAVLAVDAHDSLELIGSGGMTKDKCVRFWSTSRIDS